MIDTERLYEMFFLWGITLPTGDEMTNEGLKAIFGDELKNLMPIVLKSLCDAMAKNPEASEGYLDFIVQAIMYAKKETDDLPEIEGKSPEELRIILDHR